MVLFTLLGLCAFFLGERKKVNNTTHSGPQDESVDQSDDVPLLEINDGQTSSQDIISDPEILTTAEEPITCDPQVGDGWIDDFYFNSAMAKLNAGSVQTPVNFSPETSFDIPQVSESLAEDHMNTIMDTNSWTYDIGTELGKGGFGTVFAATRLEDDLQVAVKFASKQHAQYVRVHGYSRPIPLEIALQISANQEPRVTEIVQLLDWQDCQESDCYMMVLERPMPCQSLDDYLWNYTGTGNEILAQIVMRQVTFAAQTCCQRGVLHRDIKLENLLINPDTLDVKLIDFGCGDFLTSEVYTSFAGTPAYCPPEYKMYGMYHGEPATVWSLGILLFVMVCRDFPSRRDLLEIQNNIWTIDGYSQECCDLIRCLLQNNPMKRLKLEKISLHNWFKIDDVECNNGTSMSRSGTSSLTYCDPSTPDWLKDGYSKPIPLEVALEIDEELMRI